MEQVIAKTGLTVLTLFTVKSSVALSAGTLMLRARINSGLSKHRHSNMAECHIGYQHCMRKNH